MKTNYKGHQFEGTTAEFIDFMKLVDSGVMGKSAPTPSGKNAPKRVTLTDEERAEKTKAKNDAWKEKKKEYASQFTETEKAEYIKYKSFVFIKIKLTCYKIVSSKYYYIFIRYLFF